MDSYVGQHRNAKVYLDNEEVVEGRVTLYVGWVKVNQGDSQYPITRYYPAHRVIRVGP